MKRIHIRSHAIGASVWLSWIFCLLLFLVPQNIEAAVPVLSIDSSADSQSLNGHVEVFFDTERLHTHEEVPTLGGWEPVGNQPYSKGLEDGVAWLRFRIENPTDESIERILEISQGLADEATLWLVYADGATESYESGENTDLSDRIIESFLPHFPIRLEAGEHVDALLRMTDEGSMTAPLKLAERDHLLQEEGTRQWSNGVLSGVLGLVGIYALVLYLRMRRSIFGWLGALATASLLQWLFYHWGQASLWIPAESRAWVVNRMVVASFSITAFCCFYFFVVACELKKYRPRITRTIIGLAWLALINAILVFVLPFHIGIAVLFVSGPTGLVLLSIAVLIRAVRGDPVSRHLTLAVFLLMASYTLSVLTESGILPRIGLSPYYIPIGTVAQWLLLSEAVALRARQMEEQRRNALKAQLAEERKSHELREAFGRYVTPDRAAKILDDPEAMALGGRLRTITILMSDLRGFTGMTQRLGPPAMCELLNDYLGRMTEVIERHGGWVNEFIGDAILALFGTPVANEEDPLNACRCAIEMQMVLDEMNQELKAEGRPTLEMGIGLHTGEALVGNIGSVRRVKWGVIGDTVNMTARIESLTIGNQILMSADLIDQVRDEVETLPSKKVEVKGRQQQLEIAELRAIIGDALSMPTLIEVELMDTNVAGKLQRLSGKELSPDVEDIQIIGICDAGLVFESPTIFDEGTDLAVRLATNNGWTEAIYGKVQELEAHSIGETRTPLIFTSIDPSTQKWIDTLMS